MRSAKSKTHATVNYSFFQCVVKSRFPGARHAGHTRTAGLTSDFLCTVCVGERQREMYLREQMNAIRKELGESDPTDEMETLRHKLEGLDLPEEARKEVVGRVSGTGA